MSKLMSASLLVLTLLVVGVCSTPYTDCGSKSAIVTKVDVSDCPDTEDTCMLVKGTQKTINIQFQSQSDSSTVTAVVHGVIGGLPLPFQLPQNNGCASGLSCPLESGSDYTYTNTLDVLSWYPEVGVTVKWELQDGDKKDIVCVEIESEISAS